MKQVKTDITEWEAVEQLHHSMWVEELEKHKQRTRELIHYKTGSLKTSHDARMAQLAEQLEKAKNAKIITMKEGEIRNAINDYKNHLEKLESAISKADILAETLSYGILEVTNESGDGLIIDDDWDFQTAMQAVCTHLGREIIKRPDELVNLLETQAPHFRDEIDQIRLVMKAGIFEALNKKEGPDVDAAFDIMNKELGWEETEAEDFFQYLEPFYA